MIISKDGDMMINKDDTIAMITGLFHVLFQAVLDYMIL